MRNKKRKIQGFTLIEIMVVVVILGILAAVVVPNIMDNPDRARQARAKQDIRAMINTVNMYRLERMSYPDNLQELVGSGLIDQIPKDPWGNNYQYNKSGGRSNKGFDIYSYGLDGLEGGSGLDADIGNWE